MVGLLYPSWYVPLVFIVLALARPIRLETPMRMVGRVRARTRSVRRTGVGAHERASPRTRAGRTT